MKDFMFGIVSTIAVTGILFGIGCIVDVKYNNGEKVKALGEYID